MRGSAGFCFSKRKIQNGIVIGRSVRIALSTKVVDTADRLRDTLVHELCHAATWLVNHVIDGHGEHWRAWLVLYRFISVIMSYILVFV